MPPEPATVTLPWSGTSAAELAEAAGARDLLLFRRVADGRFAHLGGAGRGVGWAGIVEVSTAEEPLVAEMLERGGIVRLAASEATRVVGPYYARGAVAVPLDDDLFVVLGGDRPGLAELGDDELLELARAATGAVEEVSAAKRLADELEALHAVQQLLQRRPETFAEALQLLADQATLSLSCDLGIVHVPGLDLVVSDPGGSGRPDLELAACALEEIAAMEAPTCIQSAQAAELPAPFRSSDGVLAYYLLDLTAPVPGRVLLLHTRAAEARGFTELCQSLARRLVEAAEPLLTAALMRDGLRSQLERAEAEARRDALTGLANRLAWGEALGAAAELETPVSVLQLDCRGLKEINETHGHHAGDDALRLVARAARRSVRPGDLVARIGGDEFAVLLPGADEELARAVPERICAALEHERGPEGPAVRLAIGSSTCRDGDLEQAQHEADAEMLNAKRQGRGCAPR